jgi:chromosome partitioning protein
MTIKDLATHCVPLVIPAVPESFAFDGLTNTLPNASHLREQDPPSAAHHFAAQAAQPGSAAARYADRRGYSIFSSEILRFSTSEKAAAEGVPVYTVKDDRNAHLAWEAYEAAGNQINRG